MQDHEKYFVISRKVYAAQYEVEIHVFLLCLSVSINIETKREEKCVMTLVSQIWPA